MPSNSMSPGVQQKDASKELSYGAEKF